MITQDAVQELRRQAALRHGQLLGDTSACVRSKSGESFPAGKFWEGQTAALSELLRTGVEDLRSAAAELHRDWQHRPIPGEPREAESYRAGGVQALADLRAG